MSDAPSNQPPRLPPLPDEFTIPFDLVEGWFRIPADQPIELRLRRGDIDRFYSILNKTMLAQATFVQSIVEYTNGRVDDANIKTQETRRFLVEAQNDLRQFISAIMASSLGGQRRDE